MARADAQARCAASRLGVSILVAIGLACPSVASAASGTHKTHRPSPHIEEGDVTSTIPTVKAVPVPAPVNPSVSPDETALSKPFRLPSAPRERMRECGEKWQRMKMAGETGTDTWREFATICLVAATPSTGSNER